MAHTPGPWTVRDREDKSLCTQVEQGVSVEDFPYAIQVPRPPFAWGEVGALVVTSPESKGNAMLIAAAPDLAVALETLLAAGEGMLGADCPFCGAEGSWTDEHGPTARRMVPLRHRESCAYEAGYAALAKAGLIIGVEIG